MFMLAVSLLVLSVYFLYEGVAAFQQGSMDYVNQLMTGILGIMTSFFMLRQFVRRLLHMNQEPRLPNLVTVVESKKCGFKQIRKFVKGDYILKSVENCQKCNEPMIITGIYAEETKKK